MRRGLIASRLIANRRVRSMSSGKIRRGHPGRRQCRHRRDRAGPARRNVGGDDRAGSARRHLPEPRLHPKKVLVAAGHALHEIERASVHHIAVGKPRLDWAALIDREKEMIKDIPANLARSMAQARSRGDQGTAPPSPDPILIRVGTASLKPNISLSRQDQSRGRCRSQALNCMITSDEMLSERELAGLP